MNSNILTPLLLTLAAYFCGAIPFGVLMARSQGVDLHNAGSGNTGSTNVGRVLGRKWGMLCFLLDVLKGLIPVLLAGFILRSSFAQETTSGVDALNSELSVKLQLCWLATAFAAVLGHVFSIFLKFKGGKGVATSLGVLLGVWPYFTLPGVAAFVLWVLVTYISGYVSLGSIITAAGFPVMFAAWSGITGRSLTDLWPLLTFTILMALLVILKHKANISRLAAGNENRVKWSLPGSRNKIT